MSHRTIRQGLVVLFMVLWVLLLPGKLSDPVQHTFQDDAGHYHRVAVHLVEDAFYSLDGVHPSILREPGYSGFLALVYLLFGIGSRFGIFLAQGALHLLCSLFFVRQLERFTHDHRTATLTLGFLLLLPPVFHSIFFVYRESLTLSVFLLTFGLLLSFQRKSVWWKAIFIGVLLGIIGLTHFSFVFFPLFLLPLLFLWRIPLRYVSTFIILPFLLVALWGLRNASYDGHFRIIDPLRTTMIWYVRGQQATEVRGIEPLRCLWSEYVSRDWTGRSPACSFNSLMHARWPGGEPLGHEDVLAREAKQSILTHLPNYLWFSVWEVLELHLPYVNGWGRFYNILAALGSLTLYIGCLLSIARLRFSSHGPFLLLIVYTTAVFALTDATPRYLIPVIFCYAVLAAVGYAAMPGFHRSHDTLRYSSGS